MTPEATPELAPDQRIGCSVVIAARNAADTLGSQLDALARQHRPPRLEVIVVANRCSDGTADVVRRYRETGEYPHELRVVEANERAAATYARNRGVEVASFPRILVCDADDIVHPSWAAELSRSLDDADMAGGAIVLWDPDRYPDPAAMPDPILSLPGVRYDFLPATQGGNHGFSREIWLRVGGFDEEFRNATDVDFTWRVLLAGGRLAINEKALVYVRERPTLVGIYHRERAYGRGEAQLYRKFRDYGMPKPQRFGRRPLVRYTHQVLSSYRLLWPAGRRVWVRHLGKNVGRLEGSARYRVPYL